MNILSASVTGHVEVSSNDALALLIFLASNSAFRISFEYLPDYFYMTLSDLNTEALYVYCSLLFERIIRFEYKNTRIFGLVRYSSLTLRVRLRHSLQSYASESITVLSYCHEMKSFITNNRRHRLAFKEQFVI